MCSLCHTNLSFSCAVRTAVQSGFAAILCHDRVLLKRCLWRVVRSTGGSWVRRIGHSVKHGRAQQTACVVWWNKGRSTYSAQQNFAWTQRSKHDSTFHWQWFKFNCNTELTFVCCTVTVCGHGVKRHKGKGITRISGNCSFHSAVRHRLGQTCSP